MAINGRAVFIRALARARGDHAKPSIGQSRHHRQRRNCSHRMPLFGKRSARMTLVHGQDIAALAVEREVSGWDGTQFARLCNALAWAMTWPGEQAIPAFTERVNVADNGIDAEWEGDFAAGTASAFLRNGSNVFQYKKRATNAQNRGGLAAEFRRELQGEISRIQARTGTRIASYVFFTNIDLTTAQQTEIREAILAGADATLTQASVVSAAQLAAGLNQLLNYAEYGEEQALAVCQAITGGRPGFWPIAFGLVDLHPQSARVVRELEARIEQMGQVIRGPLSEHYRRCLDDVAQAHETPDASTEVRAWLDQYSCRLESASAERARQEADERINRG